MSNNSKFNIPLKVNKDFTKALIKLEDQYGEDFEILNGFSERNLNFSDFIDAFTMRNSVVADVTIDANANAANKDIRSLMIEKDKPMDKIFAFNKIFLELKQKYGLKTAREWLETEYNGGFYLHDASSSSYMGYCYAYDLTRLAKEGLFFLKKYNAVPPKHLDTFIDDTIEFISFMSNRSSGAVGIPNVLIWTYYFWKKDVEDGYYTKTPERYLKQGFQKLIYRLNQPFMRIDQTAFVNVSIFDRSYCENLFGGLIYPDGTLFVDEIENFIEHQKVFMETISEIRSENMFTFPVLTYSLHYKDGAFVDEEFARWCSDHNSKWNDSNFFVSSDVTTLSNCCRLLSDTTKLKGFMNSIGGTSISIGSIKVNTINLVRLALEILNKSDRSNKAEDEIKFLKSLRARTELCCKVLDVQREIIEKNISRDLLPNYIEGGVDINHQYSTIGILGLYEAIREFGYINSDEFDNKSYTEDGIRFAEEIFKVLNDVKDHFTDKYTFNIESVPAERAAIVLCEKDNLLYGRSIDKLYSNQWIPLKDKCTIQEKIKLSSILDPLCSGGAIAHINIESNFPNTDVAWELLNKIAKQGVIYFAFNTKINVCKNHHGFVGSDTCPICSEKIYDTYTRIVGFLTPTKSYSKERKEEFDLRNWYEYTEIKDL